jgi:general secretion pathway protein D
MAWVFAGVFSVFVSGCADLERLDRYDEAGLSRQDYEGLAARRTAAAPGADQEEPPIPVLQPILAAPQPPELAESRRVSIAVTETTPLKELLFELARKANVDLELDPGIRGGIIFAANDQPLKDVIARIADLAGLRYSFENNRLKIQVDDPYLKNYRLDFLNMRRVSNSDISTSTDVFAAVGDSGSSGGGNASSSSISSSSENDIWVELQANITQILTNAERPLVSEEDDTESDAAATQQDAQLQALAQAQQAIAQAQASGQPVDPAALETLANASAGAAGGAAATASPSGDTEQADGATEEESASTYFTLNRQGGVLTVYGTDKQQRLVATYLDMLQASIKGQVLIEAKIVEVTLNDMYRTGINWSNLDGNITLNAPLGAGVVQSGITGDQPTFSVGSSFDNINMSVLLNMVKQFGTVRTLSSPRLTVMNNQTALLKVAENEVYFRVEVESDTADGVVTRTFSSELNTVPIGLLMTVQPSIDLERNRITMGVRPTISRIVRYVDDPAVALQNIEGVSSAVPVVEVRELDSVLSIDNEQVVVMGGLMQEKRAVTQEGVPVLDRIPLAGRAFRANFEDTQVVELVIFLKATIVNDPAKSVADEDRRLYQQYAPDPRPIAF